MATFDLTSLLADLDQQAQAHFHTRPISSEEVDENLFIIHDFNEKAIGLMQQEGKIELPGTPLPVEFNQQTAGQTLTLFYHGIIHSLNKCSESHITGDPKREIIQQVALEVYNQAKQITVLTFGQEKTPNLQISDEQQRMFMTQSAENHFIHFVSEYERIHGPIDFEETPETVEDENFFPEHTTTMAGDMAPLPNPAMSLDDDWLNDDLDDDDGWMDDLQTAPPSLPATAYTQSVPNEYSNEDLDALFPQAPAVQSPYASPPPRPQLTPQHAKYAAVALLLTTLPPSSQSRILGNFHPSELDLIDYYRQNPDRVAQELDLNVVNQHLQQFKQFLEQGSPSLTSKAQRQIQHLVQAYAIEDVLSSIERERPRIKQYVEGFYAVTPEQQAQHFSDALPGKIEEILYHHLQRSLSYK